MHIYICDDDRKFSEDIKAFVLNTICKLPDYNDSYRVDCTNSPASLIEVLRKNLIDILILDISMPELDGFDIAQFICSNSISVCLIFLSNFENHVFYSLRYKPFRFVRKTRYRDELNEAVTSAVKEINAKHDSFLAIYKEQVASVFIDHIIYVEKDKHSNYINIVCIEGKFKHRSTITEFLELVKHHHFARISVNTVVNIERIIQIRKDCIIFKDSAEFVYIAPKYKKQIMHDFLLYMRKDT